ncbi:Glucose/arabinose dehydrogenase, beta-propeller fold [Nitrosomonas cryotolerans]|uniref:Glucose/arabinose dehydrogenase, beta-propeller fold n=1 Tax=Nitrosomonas cryotolerans ATCC 49181 TaxID=1131553 RepID=A0A1N6IV95_9PROT|nr:PQQ-dependent sugar dehydrogenase [Nitrosomonas cryotolerans]SFP90635.1 Glucose/arabinose dehydrogenase, beta-propeller fold [Nitrosomonas cryotolerans]SIO35961.1 Glucose/arabinose dehydrogenase, beta-propeller fold [Nitrosomonas cryotolerans ATCC 49181]
MLTRQRYTVSQATNCQIIKEIMHYILIIVLCIIAFFGDHVFLYKNSHFLSTAQAQSTSTQFQIKILASGLKHPWGMVFMPNGKMLVTERVGQLRIISQEGQISEPVKGVPAVLHKDQGGLLDVVLDPDFAKNHLIYFSYAEQTGKTAGTTVARAELIDNTLQHINVIFRQYPTTTGEKHFGSRLVFAPDGNLFITLGDRFSHMEQAQHLDNHIGKLIRIRPDGSIPTDNPFTHDPNIKPEIWSYGHRHIQGAAIHPETGALWLHEHGPRGGDEINIPKPGKNYGWPKASYGIHYWMVPIKDEHAEQGFEEPIYYWTPSIAPSGMLFYTGNLFPQWRGNLFIGALAGKHLVRLVVDAKSVLHEEKLLKNYSVRIRDVEQGPEGALYLLTDEEEGKILKLVPVTDNQ